MIKLIFIFLFIYTGIQAQEIGIGKTNPSEAVDVNGIINAKGYKYSIYQVGGNNLPYRILSRNNTWQDFPDLSLSFTLDTTTTVMIQYSISGPLGNSHLITKMIVDDSTPEEMEVGRSIQGNHTYGTNRGQYIAELSKGTHTVKVIYRTPAPPGGIQYTNSDWQTRILQVLAFGAN